MYICILYIIIYIYNIYIYRITSGMNKFVGEVRHGQTLLSSLISGDQSWNHAAAERPIRSCPQTVKPPLWSMAMTQDPIDWRYLPHISIYKADVYSGEIPTISMANHMDPYGTNVATPLDRILSHSESFPWSVAHLQPHGTTRLHPLGKAGV